MPDVMDLDYVYCNTSEAVKGAAAVLNTSTILAFDCEGRNLGALGGKLSLISLRNFLSGHSTQTFLIDTVALKGKSLEPIYDILRSNRIRKVVFDGRKDYSCLFHDRKVDIQNVLDLQLADVKSRAIRGEGDTWRIVRLSESVPTWELSQNAPKYEGIHKISGMKKCAEEHLGWKAEKDSKLDHELWLERPLSGKHLFHAIEDVVIIGWLYNVFDEAGFLYAQIMDDSLRYVSVWKDRRPEADEIYLGPRCNALVAKETSLDRAFYEVGEIPRRNAVSATLLKGYMNGVFVLALVGWGSVGEPQTVVAEVEERAAKGGEGEEGGGELEVEEKAREAEENVHMEPAREEQVGACEAEEAHLPAEVLAAIVDEELFLVYLQVDFTHKG
ncbi:hypothetical protein DXG01_012414 [Tephrocybe rancida]|nr:hypothetical protein DXG01_012414 [Tephrocybe rancida]